MIKITKTNTILKQQESKQAKKNQTNPKQITKTKNPDNQTQNLHMNFFELS